MIKERHLFKNLPIRGGSSLAIRRVASKSIRSKTFSNEYALTVLEKKSDWAQFISNKTVNQHQKDAMIMHLLKVTRVIREPIFLRNLVVLDVHALEIHGNYSNVKYNANNLTYQAEPDLVIINNRTGVQTFED